MTFWWFGVLVRRCLTNTRYLTRNLLVSTSPAGEAVCRAFARLENWEYSGARWEPLLQHGHNIRFRSGDAEPTSISFFQVNVAG